MLRRAVRVLSLSAVSLSSVLFIAGTGPARADDQASESSHHHRHHHHTEDESPPTTVTPTTVTVTITGAEPTDSAEQAPADGTTPDGTTATTDPPAGDGSATTAPETTAPETTAPETTVPVTLPEPVDVPLGNGVDQAVTITDVQVAVAGTGSNQLVTTGGTAAAGGSGTDVATGPATAVGSQDSTVVSQQATADLSGNATADITQIVFVFNLGVASATSGGNAATSGTGSGAVSTGSAVAVGNSGSNYITQAGSADATGTPSASTGQVSITVRVGVAVANSGANGVTGAADGSSQISAGSATATGNLSTSNITQTAAATGSDDAHLVIGQQAVVVNIGVSLANSGMNGLTDLASALVSAPDANAAAQLFASLLPALLSAYAATSGGGAVATGDATAIGNNTSTFISQSATATASGDGTAAVQQQVSVGNVGAAIANTGLNNSGASMAPATLDAASQQIVSQLAAYLAALFTSANAWVPGDPAPSVPSTLTLSNGAVNFDVGSSISGTQTEFGSADTGGPHGTIRQIVAVFSLGVSSANSGSNTTVDVGVTDDGSLIVAPAGSITTGDAVAVNSGTIVVCQRGNQPTATCLGPSDDASEPPVVRPPVGADSGRLPATGDDARLLLTIALGLLLVGASLTLAGRRAALR